MKQAMKQAMKQEEEQADALHDAGLLVLRDTFGTLLAGHGSQMLFGWFGGNGLDGTAMWLESLGLKPGKPWAMMAGLSEFGGGALTSLGLLHPLGPILTLGGMGTATFKMHWGKPIWVTSGGAELPVLNIAIATALLLTGPGRFSLDNLLGIRLPRWLAIPGGALAAAGVAFSIIVSQANQEAQRSQAQDGAATDQARRQDQAAEQQQAASRPA